MATPALMAISSSPSMTPPATAAMGTAVLLTTSPREL
jgi:hypothetical protein